MMTNLFDLEAMLGIPQGGPQGLFGGLGFEPMSQESLGMLGITNPNAMEFRTPRFDQPFTPFGGFEMQPHGYNLQFPNDPMIPPNTPVNNFGNRVGNGGFFGGGGQAPIPGVTQQRLDQISPANQLRRWVASGMNPAAWNPGQFEQNPLTGRWLDIDMLGGG